MNNILYQQANFPILQNRVYDSKSEALNCTTGNLEIVQNYKSGLIYNDAFDPDLIVYDSNYNNEQSISQHFQKHLIQVADIIQRNIGINGLLEVGCGKGYFLEMLLSRGVDITGFDPTYDGDNSRIIKKYFEAGIIDTPAKGLILRHVLEHVQNPVSFLYDLKNANGGKGLIYIEVPCFDWICKKRNWFDIFYEHVNYFRLTDFERIFDNVIESGRFFGDQYLFVVADLSSLREPIINHVDTIKFPSDMLSDLNSIEQKKSEFPFTIWGGGSKGVIYSLLYQRSGINIDMAIDVNPAKQGKYMPVTGIRIYSPQEALKGLKPGTPIYVMNSNYLDEIKSMSNYMYNYIEVEL